MLGAAANDIQDIDWSDSSGEDDTVLTLIHQASKKRKQAQHTNQSLPKNKPNSSFLADNPSSNDIISQCSSASGDIVVNRNKTISVLDYKPSRKIKYIATKEHHGNISPRLRAVRKLYQDVENANESISDIASGEDGTHSDDASVGSNVSEQSGNEIRKQGENKKQLLSQSQVNICITYVLSKILKRLI